MQLPSLFANFIRYVKKVLGFPNQEVKESNKVSVDIQSGVPDGNAEMEQLRLEKKVKSLTEENLAMKNKLNAFELTLGSILHKVRNLD